MINIVIINKNGKSTTKSVKSLDKSKLYLKCGLKTGKNFELRNIFKMKQKNSTKFIHIYSKNSGKSNFENKFEMPPPIDKDLYFGNILILKSLDKNGETFENYTSDEWLKDYETLMGGFEDINTTNDEEEEDELKNVSKDKLTKEGYLKDGFIISNSDDSEYNESDESDEDTNVSDNEIEKVNIKQTNKTKIKKKIILKEENADEDDISGDEEDDCDEEDEGDEGDESEEYTTNDESYEMDEEDEDSEDEDISELEEEDYIDED